MPARLRGLPASAFMHPADKEAFDILRTTSGFETVFRKVMHYGFEKAYRIQLMGGAVRLSPTQCPSLYARFTEGMAMLDVQDDVELFTLQSPTINAFTFGAEKVGLVIHTAALEHLTDDELFFMICHELGHVKCGHVLYRFMAEIMGYLVTLLAHYTLGIGALLSQGLMMALLSWYRKSELSADRAGLLAVQDVEVAKSSFMKLAGGSPRIFEEMNLEEFEKQAQDVEGSESIVDALWQVFLTMRLTHPWLSVRVKELEKWAKDGNYQRILGGEYGVAGWPEGAAAAAGEPRGGDGAGRHRATRLCFECNTANDMAATQCKQCGATLIRVKRG